MESRWVLDVTHYRTLGAPPPLSLNLSLPGLTARFKADIVAVSGNCSSRPSPDRRCQPSSRRSATSSRRIGESQRILPHAVAQKFETSSSGALIPAGSTKPVSMQVTHAGIATVEQYDLRRS